jgi:hypothetical protein
MTHIAGHGVLGVKTVNARRPVGLPKAKRKLENTLSQPPPHNDAKFGRTPTHPDSDFGRPTLVPDAGINPPPTLKPTPVQSGSWQTLDGANTISGGGLMSTARGFGGWTDPNSIHYRGEGNTLSEDYWRNYAIDPALRVWSDPREAALYGGTVGAGPKGPGEAGVDLAQILSANQTAAQSGTVPNAGGASPAMPGMKQVGAGATDYVAPVFGADGAADRAAQLGAILADIEANRSYIDEQEMFGLGDVGRAYDAARRPVGGAMNRRGMLDSGVRNLVLRKLEEQDLRQRGRMSYEFSGLRGDMDALEQQAYGGMSASAVAAAIQDAVRRAQMHAQLKDSAF